LKWGLKSFLPGLASETLCLPVAGIKGMNHGTQPYKVVFKHLILTLWNILVILKHLITGRILIFKPIVGRKLPY
jgi:hypothetical protein